MNRKYSVLMSLYNEEKPENFALSLESMLNQTIEPDEIILVLDGSINENLQRIVRCFSVKYPNIMKVIPLEENIGLGLALNEGIKVARNELLARMDTDDISYPNRIELQLKEFEKNPILDIVGTLTSEFYDTPNNIFASRIVPETHDEIIKFSKRRSPFNHATVMYKKSAVEAVNGYRDVLRNEDLDLFGRMLNNNSIAKNLQIPLYYVRADKNNYMRRKSWTNCRNYISVIYNFWENGYSSFIDLVYVIVTQVGIFISPIWLLKYVSDNYLRKKTK